MKKKSTTHTFHVLQIFKFAPGDSFFELAYEIEHLIARRAYKLFESRGFVDGDDREDWLRAQPEIIVNIPADVAETETELMVRADVPGLSEKNLEVRVAPRALCITGKRHLGLNRDGEGTFDSERRSIQIFLPLSLPSEIDPNRTDATLEDGILEIKLLKVRTGRKIPVRTRSAPV
jgi:HSP20 family molecular chaperone IbpA